MIQGSSEGSVRASPESPGKPGRPSGAGKKQAEQKRRRHARAGENIAEEAARGCGFTFHGIDITSLPHVWQAGT